MLYLVTLTYIRPLDEVEAHLDTHKQWLAEHARTGRILAAGPLEDRSGGILIAHCDSRVELDAILAQDSFCIQGVARPSFRGFEAGLRTQDFPARWAPHAKAVLA